MMHIITLSVIAITLYAALGTLLYFHRQARILGFIPLMMVMGMIVAILESQVGVFIDTGFSFFLGSGILVPVIISILLVIYVINGSIFARVTIYGLFIVNILTVALFYVYQFYAQIGGTVQDSIGVGNLWEAINFVKHPFTPQSAVASIVAFLLDLLVIVVSYQFIRNFAYRNIRLKMNSKSPIREATRYGVEWVSVFLALALVLCLDSVIYNIISRFDSLSFQNLLTGDVIGKSFSALVLSPMIAAYLGRYHPDFNPVLSDKTVSSNADQALSLPNSIAARPAIKAVSPFISLDHPRFLFPAHPASNGKLLRSALDIFNGSLEDLSTLRNTIRDLEKTLQQSEVQRQEEAVYFKQISDNIDEGLWMSEPLMLRPFYVNKAYEKIWGVDTARIYNDLTFFSDALHEEDRDRVLDNLNKQVDQSRYDVEYRIVRPDGTIRWIRDRAFPIKDDKGLAYRVAGIAEDITDRREAEQRARENQYFYEQAQSIGHIGTWSRGLQEDQPFIWSSENFHIFGISPDQFDGKLRSLWTYVHREDLYNVQDAWTETVQNHKPFQIDYRIIRPDGTTRWIHQRAQTIFDSKNEPLRIVGITQDITERKEMENHALELRLERERGKNLRDFISEASHDLRRPLTSIALKLYLIRRTTDEEKRNHEFDQLAEQIDRMGKMIDDFLTLSRLERETEPPFIYCNFHQIWSQILVGAVPLADNKQIKIEMEISRQQFLLKADIEDLSRAFFNLLDNAIRYTQRDGKIIIRDHLVPVDIQHMNEGDMRMTHHISILIQDTGIGIPEEDIPLLFERSFRSANAQDFDPTGTGLGLPIVKKIVDRHSGTIDISSVVGKGTTFTVKFPVYHVKSV